MAYSYDSIAQEWHASLSGFRAKKYVDLILNSLKPGARVLDLGCGTGKPIAEYLEQTGFRVVGVDASANMLKIARQVAPKAVLIQADMCDLSFRTTFAAVVAWDSLFHVSRVHHQAVYHKLYRLLDDGGLLLLSAGGSEHEGFTSEMFGQTFFYSGYEPGETVRLLQAEGFVVDLCEEDDPSSRGHVAIIATKKAYFI